MQGEPVGCCSVFVVYHFFVRLLPKYNNRVIPGTRERILVCTPNWIGTQLLLEHTNFWGLDFSRKRNYLSPILKFRYMDHRRVPKMDIIPKSLFRSPIDPVPPFAQSK
jgi:hypothetical protein